MASKEMSESSVASDTEHFEGNNDDNETTETARKRFLLDLSEKGINADLVFHEERDGDDDDDGNSEMTLDLKEYALDLGQQKMTREDTIKQEAFEEARVWYRKA